MDMSRRRRRIGRVERQITRYFIAADGADVRFPDFVDWAYLGGRRVWRQVIYAALKRCGGRNVGYGRWRASDALMRAIRGESGER